jgi:hypothetical protein
MQVAVFLLGILESVFLEEAIYPARHFVCAALSTGDYRGWSLSFPYTFVPVVDLCQSYE